MNIKKYTETVSFENAKAEIPEYEYALIYKLSEVIFDRVARCSQIDWEECQEAYFFGENSQLHIYQEDDEFLAVRFRESENAGLKSVTRKYELANKFQKIGKYIVIREYLDKDRDGQNFVAYKRLVGVN